MKGLRLCQGIGKMNAFYEKIFDHPQTLIGIDLGDKKHAVCVLDQDGKVICEKSISNQRKSLEALYED